MPQDNKRPWFNIGNTVSICGFMVYAYRTFLGNKIESLQKKFQNKWDDESHVFMTNSKMAYYVHVCMSSPFLIFRVIFIHFLTVDHNFCRGIY